MKKMATQRRRAIVSGIIRKERVASYVKLSETLTRPHAADRELSVVHNGYKLDIAKSVRYRNHS